MEKHRINRRDFLRFGGLGMAAAATNLCGAQSVFPQQLSNRPNILWLTCEDIGPNLGCYGDAYAITPTLDSLSKKGIRYTNAFSVAGVCAPSRSCLITGVYPWTLGSQHMRSDIKLPAKIKCFTEYLREAGCYCTNNYKTDYNFSPSQSAWDECDKHADWRNRSRNQPFFSIYNFTITHEGSINRSSHNHAKAIEKLKADQIHNPDKAVVPPYLPDTPKVRKVLAQYADMITIVDTLVAKKLRQLEADGLAEDTIIFFYSDHGPGLPRCKFWCYDSSTQVPLVVYFPPKYRHLAGYECGSVTDRLVSFVDFAPTILNLLKIQIPDYMQGKTFLGPDVAEPRNYVISGRDRLGALRDMVRSVRDKKYHYIRNFMPHLPWSSDGYYYNTTQQAQQEINRLSKEGNLSGPAARYQLSKSRPAEELYDIQADPHEIDNLAGSGKHRKILERMRAILLTEIIDNHDMGLMPEVLMNSRGNSPYEIRADKRLYPQKRLLEIAELIRLNSGTPEQFFSMLKDDEATIRYWAILGLLNLKDTSKPTIDALTARLEDASVDVRLQAADALVRMGYPNQAKDVALKELENQSEWARLFAMGVLEQMGMQACPYVDKIAQAIKTTRNSYVKLVMEFILKKFKLMEKNQWPWTGQTQLEQ